MGFQVVTHAREESGQPGTFDSLQYTDGLGRTLAQLEESDDGYAVSKAVRFTARGTVRETLQPYTSATAAYGGLPDGDATRVQYDATTLSVSWADLYGAWNWTSQGIHPGQIQPGAPVRLRYRLACRPDVEESSDRFIAPPRIVTSAAHGIAGGADNRTIILRVDVDAIRAVCSAH